MAAADEGPGSSRQEGQLLSLIATAAVRRTAASSVGLGGCTKAAAMREDMIHSLGAPGESWLSTDGVLPAGESLAGCERS